MLEEGLEYRVDSHVAELIIDNPDTNNSLNPALLRRADQLLETMRMDSDIRVLLLSARGPVFCNGMDFQLMSDVHQKSTQSGGAHASSRAAQHAARQFTRFLTALRNFPKPVCAIVNGQVRAGGVGMVAAADIVLATERARFELSELLFDLLPAVVLPFLLERISLKDARYLCLTARNLSATEAAQIGLIDQLTADDLSLEKSRNALLRQLLRISPNAIPKLKSYTDRLSVLPHFSHKTRLGRKFLTKLLNNQHIQRVIRTFHDEGLTPPWFTAYRPVNKGKQV